MAKARKKKARKPASRVAKKRKVAKSKSKARRSAGVKSWGAKGRQHESLAAAVGDAVHDAASLRRRLAGRNTFED